MAKTANQILTMAQKYVGTKESPANSNNVIFNTHYYGKAVRGSAYPWCAVFLWDIFRMAGASELYYGGQKCAYTPSLANYYKNQSRWYSTPKPGDLVFFKFAGSSRINHVGIVKRVISANKIETIEGNTGTGNDANGGCVMLRQRATTYVVGYGRPNYGTTSTSNTSTSASTPSTNTKYTKDAFIRDVCAILKVKNANEAFNKSITISQHSNKSHALVTPIERYMKALGYYTGSIEADSGKVPSFGPGMTSAVKKFQKEVVKASAKGQDGIISARGNTWKKLLL